MIQVDGIDYGTAAQIAARLGPDITATMVRNWARRDGLPTWRCGRHVWYPLHTAARIESQKRRSGLGRPRRVDNDSLLAA